MLNNFSGQEPTYRNSRRAQDSMELSGHGARVQPKQR